MAFEQLSRKTWCTLKLFQINVQIGAADNLIQSVHNFVDLNCDHRCETFLPKLNEIGFIKLQLNMLKQYYEFIQNNEDVPPPFYFGVTIKMLQRQLEQHCLTYFYTVVHHWALLNGCTFQAALNWMDNDNFI